MNWVSSAVVAAILGAIAGGITGHFVRKSEFRRDQRLRVYGSFMHAFLDVAVSGADLQSISMSYGHPGDPSDAQYAEAKHAAYKAGFERHTPHRAAFMECGAELRMVASSDVRKAAEVVEDWVIANVHSSPPFTREFDKAGEAAKIGPAAVANATTGVARTFADAARVDIVGHQWRGKD